MPINPKNVYPKYNKNMSTNCLDIPDNIRRQFGIYEFSFIEGTKVNYKTKQYNGDYQICINNKNWRDFEIWNLFTTNINQNNEQLIERLLLIIEYLWSELNTEYDVYNHILQFNNKFNETFNLLKKFTISLDLIQSFLYYSWHRCHIEERAYPSEEGYNGRGDYLGATYILFANKYNLQPLDKKIKNNKFSDPKEVDSLANNKNNKYLNFRKLKKIGFENYLALINQMNNHKIIL
jgi:hypothetical protein